MAITGTQLVDFARAHNKLAVISGIGGVANEPALSFCNKIKRRIISQTLNWSWNRKTESSFTTTNETEDYTPTATDIYWVERAYAENEDDTATPKYRYPLEVVRDLPRNWEKGDPKKIALVLNSAGSERWRLYPMSGNFEWRIYVEYQAKPVAMTALSDNFNPIPDEMSDVLTQFMLAFSYKLTDKNMHLSELAEAERLLAMYRKFHVNEEPETGFYPEHSLFIG